MPGMVQLEFRNYGWTHLILLNDPYRAVKMRADDWPLPGLNRVKHQGIHPKIQTRNYSVLKQRVRKCEQGQAVEAICPQQVNKKQKWNMSVWTKGI